uniref:tetraacyldisaccharide 4'-kinase n=1 Tax=Cyanobium sp. TaxID=2164130 RepID=UPI0040482868
MPRNAPSFWYAPRLSGLARVLLPLSWFYGVGVWLHRSTTRPLHLPVPVISIGNITLGGTGKTPVVMGLARALQKRGYAVAVLLRGYGTKRREPMLVTPGASYAEVGDEALEYAHQLEQVQIWVGSNRRLSARLAIDQGATLLLLDDGLQHWPLARDLDVTLLDAQHGLGNGQVFPAGPLREPASQLGRADLLVLTGTGTDMGSDALGEAPLPWPSQKPRRSLRFQLDVPYGLLGWPLVAFCGIGLPQKFFQALRALGLRVIAEESFPDHHPYAEAELERLLAVAQAQGAVLVTTSKDANRLPMQYRSKVVPIPLSIDPVALDPLAQQLLGLIGHA